MPKSIAQLGSSSLTPLQLDDLASRDKQTSWKGKFIQIGRVVTGLVTNRLFPDSLEECMRIRAINCVKNIYQGPNYTKLQQSQFATTKIRSILDQQLKQFDAEALLAIRAQQIKYAIDELDSVVLSTLIAFTPSEELPSFIEKNNLLYQVCKVALKGFEENRRGVVDAFIQGIGFNLFKQVAPKTITQISQERPKALGRYVNFFKGAPSYSSFDSDAAAINQLLQRATQVGIDLNVKDESGRTPMIHAVMNNHYNLMESLIRAGARVDEKDNQGMTALDYAKNHSWQQAVSPASPFYDEEGLLDGVQTLTFQGHPKCEKRIIEVLSEQGSSQKLKEV